MTHYFDYLFHIFLSFLHVLLDFYCCFDFVECFFNFSMIIIIMSSNLSYSWVWRVIYLWFKLKQQHFFKICTSESSVLNCCYEKILHVFMKDNVCTYSLKYFFPSFLQSLVSFPKSHRLFDPKVESVVLSIFFVFLWQRGSKWRYLTYRSIPGQTPHTMKLIIRGRAKI